jgi:hypothetical protein
MSSQWGASAFERQSQNGLGSAAAAAARTQDSNEARLRHEPGPEEKHDHRQEGGPAQDSSPIGPPDAKQLKALTAQAMVAELLLENAMLRLDVQRLSDRVDHLERRGVGR